MCFSAEASFTAGTILSVVGFISIKKTGRRKHMFFAAIPLVFGIQQLSEGVLWLSLSGKAVISEEAFTIIFLLFAQVIWPVWIPLSFLRMEKEEQRKKVLKIFLLLGSLIAAYMLFCLLAYGVESKIANCHIHYDLKFEYSYLWLGSAFYILPTVISPFVSSVKRSNILGLLVLSTFLISLFFYRENLISVWCFFAAVVSAYVLYMVYRLEKEADI